jgi:hypothetical protein
LQFREYVLPPKSGGLLYASLALLMVVLSRRERLVALGAAIGIDLVIALARLLLDIRAEGNLYGSGALWVVLGFGVLALARRTGAERVLLLKGVGLATILVAGRKAGDVWLLMTSATRHTVLDQYVAVADHALGNPSWVMGRIVDATGALGFNALDFVYGQLALMAVVVSLYQLRHVARDRAFPRHHLVRTFLAIGLLGPAVYMIFPVVGPIFAYGVGTDYWEPISLWAEAHNTLHWAVGDLWPTTAPPVTSPQAMPFDEITPRNCMPSLHTAWAVAIYLHSRQGPAVLRHAGTAWLAATLVATLGFGYHYGADLVAGVVFVLTVEAAIRTWDRAWDRAGLAFVGYGFAVFAAMLCAYRWLPVWMARTPWLAGPLLLLAMVSVIVAYVRLTRRWREAEAPRQPGATAPVPEPAA